MKVFGLPRSQSLQILPCLLPGSGDPNDHAYGSAVFVVKSRPIAHEKNLKSCTPRSCRSVIHPDRFCTSLSWPVVCPAGAGALTCYVCARSWMNSWAKNFFICCTVWPNGLNCEFTLSAMLVGKVPNKALFSSKDGRQRSLQYAPVCPAEWKSSMMKLFYDRR